MNRNVIICFIVVIAVGIFQQDKICENLELGKSEQAEEFKTVVLEKEMTSSDTELEHNYYVNDTIYHWDEELLEFVIAKRAGAFRPQFVSNTLPYRSLEEPIEVDWSVLMDIQYRLRYFSELDMEMQAPIFPSAVEQLHEKEVIIEGFVIPFEEEGLLSLSYNPYASCFFCGKGSPASVISMYLKKKRKRYKIDDFKKFRGTLYLNHDDPNEFYYILRDARVE